MFVLYKNYRNVFTAMFLLTLLALPLAACDSGNKSTQSTPTPTPTTPLFGSAVTLDLGIPKSAWNAPVVGNVPASMPMHVVLNFKLNQNELNQLGSQKASSNQNTDLSKVANQIGITDQQYTQIKSYFGASGATLTLNKLHSSLTITGTADTFSKTLHTTFVYRQYKGRKFFAPAAPFVIPANIASSIKAITGLDNYTPPPVAGSASFRQASSSAAKRASASSNCFNTGYDDDPPQAVASAYGFTTLHQHGWNGKGTTVILVEFAPFSVSDVQAYFSCVNFQGTLNTVTVDNDPPTDTTWSFEPLLDVEMVAGLAPLANIEVYQIQNGRGYDAVLQQIIQDNSTPSGLKVVSISWGSGESEYSTDYMSAVSQDIQVLTQTEHMTVFTSSGDCGAYGSRTYPATPEVNFPASSPWTVAVGGTHLDTASNGARSNETVWGMTSGADPNTCDNSWGSGGGVSTQFQQPQWQSGVAGIKNTYSNGSRQVPDIAAVAEQLPVYYQGGWGDGSGTSAAAPIWATGFLLANAALSYNKHLFYFGPAVFYAAAEHSGKWQPFYGVQKGNNRYYTASPGWNYCTGLGAPNLVGFYDTVLTYM